MESKEFFFAVGKDGTEYMSDYFIHRSEDYFKENPNKVDTHLCDYYSNIFYSDYGDELSEEYLVELPKGSINLLIGRELKYEDGILSGELSVVENKFVFNLKQVL